MTMTQTLSEKWYKLLVGQHVQGDLDAPPSKKNGAHPERTYSAGDVFRSTADLERLNGSGMQRKFERLDGEVARLHGGPEHYPPELLARAAEWLRAQQSAPPPAFEEEQRTATQAPLPTAHVQVAVPPQPVPQKSKRSAKELAAALEKMGEQKLREMAAAEEVDLEGASSRQEIIKILLQELT